MNIETEPRVTISSAEAEQRLDSLRILSDVVFQFVRVQRATIMPDGEHETDGEHTIHLGFLAVAYAAEFRPDLDVGRVAIDALVHDFVEVYAGDVPSLGASDEIMLAKKQKETEAFDLLKSVLADWPQLLSYIESYEDLDHEEAKYVKSFDKLTPGFTHFSNKGESLKHGHGIFNADDFCAQVDKTLERMRPYADNYADVLAIRDRLTAGIVRAAFSDGYEQLKLY